MGNALFRWNIVPFSVAFLFCTSQMSMFGLGINPCWKLCNMLGVFRHSFSIYKQWLRRTILCPISGAKADIYGPDQSSWFIKLVIYEGSNGNYD